MKKNITIICGTLCLVTLTSSCTLIEPVSDQAEAISYLQDKSQVEMYFDLNKDLLDASLYKKLCEKGKSFEMELSDWHKIGAQCGKVYDSFTAEETGSLTELIK